MDTLILAKPVAEVAENLDFLNLVWPESDHGHRLVLAIHMAIGQMVPVARRCGHGQICPRGHLDT